MKQHCCRTWQGPSLARNLDSCCSWNFAPKMTLFHVGCVWCRLTLWGNLWTQSNEGPRNRCFTLGLWFHVGFREDLVIFFMLFRVGVYVWDAWRVEIHCFENGKTPQVSLRSRPWRGLSKLRCFMSGWGFVSGLQVPNLKCYAVFAGHSKPSLGTSEARESALPTCLLSSLKDHGIGCKAWMVTSHGSLTNSDMDGVRNMDELHHQPWSMNDESKQT